MVHLFLLVLISAVWLPLKGWSDEPVCPDSQNGQMVQPAEMVHSVDEPLGGREEVATESVPAEEAVSNPAEVREEVATENVPAEEAVPQKVQPSVEVARKAGSSVDKPEESLPPVCKKCLKKRWFFELKPGYLYFTDSDMRSFFNNGGFTMRGEVDCNFWGPLMVWIDGGYYQGDGKAIGSNAKIETMIATITLGLKAFCPLGKHVIFYAGAGPRLFMLKIENSSPYVRGEDHEIGVGGGFTSGFWFFPIPKVPNLYIDLFADYSWKEMRITEDQGSSFDYNVNISGITGGLGLGVRF